MSITADELITATTAENLLGFARSSIRRTGLTPVMVDGQPFYRKEDVERYRDTLTARPLGRRRNGESQEEYQRRVAATAPQGFIRVGVAAQRLGVSKQTMLTIARREHMTTREHQHATYVKEAEIKAYEERNAVV